MPNLIGPGLNQAPNNGMLGGMAYQSPDNVKVKKIDIETISGVEAQIRRTAVNVFLYDTSRDSDGGAWRHRTSETSWYNEELNTQFRGGRREFPSVALIAVFRDQTIIYDADDPNLPMWMIFVEPYASSGAHTVRKMIGQASPAGQPFPVKALNGAIYVAGIDPWHDGLTEVNFILDKSKLLMGDGVRYGQYNIANRNITGCYTSSANQSTPALVSNLGYTMDVKVLPGAYVDLAAGLPIPSIAFGSNAGTCAGDTYSQFYDITYTNFGVPGDVGFTFDNKFYTFVDSAFYQTRFLRVYDVPKQDFSGGAYNSHTNELRSYCSDYIAPAYGYDMTALWNNHNGWGNIYHHGLSTTDDGFALYHNDRGVTLIKENILDPTNGMIYGIGSNSVSGWMHGLIRGSWLAWADPTLETKTIVSAGIYHVTTAARSANYSVEYSDDNSTWTTAFSGVMDSGSSVGEKTGTNPGNGSYGAHRYWRYVEGSAVSGHHPRVSRIFLTDSDGIKHHIAFYYQDNSTDYGDYQIGTVNWDTYHIGATKDRSFGLCGLNVSGSIEKSAVAPGAELTGWKFTSSSDYFTQVDANNGNNLIGTQIGTGNFAIMLWFKTPSYTGGPTFVDIAGAVSPRFFVGADYRADRMWIYINTTSGTVDYSVYTDLIANDQWNFIALKRVGTTMYTSLNGNNWVTNTNAAWGGDLNSASNYITIGQNYTHGAGIGHSLALVRISQSNPSLDDVQQIYAMEKDLFTENAKCTGSDDAYNTAFDAKTKSLYISSADGLHEFKGIRRINNSTIPRTSYALSAYDGLVADQ